MKTILLFFAIVFSGLLAIGQELAKDQNPNYATSRDKYMKLSDSVNATQSTTAQQTYKAIDYLADKEEARDARKQFRRDLRMERARHNYLYNDMSYRYPRNNWPYSSYYGRPNYQRFNNPVMWGTVGSPFFWNWMYR